jgi:hypothetical protein
MFRRCKSSVALALALMLVAVGAQAAATRIETFDGKTWQRLVQDLPRPAAVVFSSTDCSFCPGTIAALAEHIKERKGAIALIVVVMDGDGQPDLLQEPHYAPASRLFVFKGQGAVLQHSINPAWHGITPYVALFGAAGAPRMVLGKPSPQVLADWLAGAASATAPAPSHR